MTHIAPLGLERGDVIEHPWGEFTVLGVRGDPLDLPAEYYVRDSTTGEELWVSFEGLLQLSKINLDMNYPDAVSREHVMEDDS